MKILVPRWPFSSKDCDTFDCSRFDCEKYYINGKKKKRPFFQKGKKATLSCGRYQCGQVTIPGEKK